MASDEWKEEIAAWIGPKAGELVDKIEVGPYDQSNVLLGAFTERDALKGFSIELHPKPSMADAVVTKITALGGAKKYRLILHIVNFSDRPVTAEIRRL